MPPAPRPLAPRSELQARYGLESNRSIPEWGRAIFSPLCVIVRPQGGEELGRFLKYALALNQLHVQVGALVEEQQCCNLRVRAAVAGVGRFWGWRTSVTQCSAGPLCIMPSL